MATVAGTRNESGKLNYYCKGFSRVGGPEAGWVG